MYFTPLIKRLLLCFLLRYFACLFNYYPLIILHNPPIRWWIDCKMKEIANWTLKHTMLLMWNVQRFSANRLQCITFAVNIWWTMLSWSSDWYVGSIHSTNDTWKASSSNEAISHSLHINSSCWHLDVAAANHIQCCAGVDDHSMKSALRHVKAVTNTAVWFWCPQHPQSCQNFRLDRMVLVS